MGPSVSSLWVCPCYGSFEAHFGFLRFLGSRMKQDPFSLPGQTWAQTGVLLRNLQLSYLNTEIPLFVIFLLWQLSLRPFTATQKKEHVGIVGGCGFGFGLHSFMFGDFIASRF